MGTGGSWQLGASEIYNFDSYGNVVFEVIPTGGATGYLAIDDIKIDSSLECSVHGKSL